MLDSRFCYFRKPKFFRRRYSQWEYNKNVPSDISSQEQQNCENIKNFANICWVNGRLAFFSRALISTQKDFLRLVVQNTTAETFSSFPTLYWKFNYSLQIYNIDLRDITSKVIIETIPGSWKICYSFLRYCWNSPERCKTEKLKFVGENT